MAVEYVLAVDLGGTNLRVSAIARDGTVLHETRGATPSKSAQTAIIENIVGQAEECVNSVAHPPLAFGVAAAALVNTSSGRVFSSPNLPQLNDSPLADLLSDRLGIDVKLENDATAAAIGEAWLGASKHSKHSICVTLGTGIGGGLILDGRPYRGAIGTAGEIGHICVEPDGHACGCGSRGCVEQYSSATGIVRIAAELLPEHPNSRLTADALSARTIYEAAKQGDPVGVETFHRMARYLGIALAGLVDILNPEIIVVTGGVARGWDMFADSLREEVRTRSFKDPFEATVIIPGELGDLAGILGAARVAFDAAESADGFNENLS